MTTKDLSMDSKLAPIFERAHSKFALRKTPWAVRDLVDEIINQAKGIDFNDYRREIITSWANEKVESHLAKGLPAGQDGQLSFDLMTEEYLKNADIRLGKGKRLSLWSSNYSAIDVMHINQTKAVENVARAAGRTAEFKASEPGTMMRENPNMILGDALNKTGRLKKTGKKTA